MPIATKHSTILEESHQNTISDDNKVVIERLDVKLFDDIKQLMEKAKQFEEEEEKCKRKIEKYKQLNEVAEEMIAKAENKKAELIKRNEFLKTCLEQKEDKKRQALKYWEDYGISVRQISSEEDNFQQYEFIYSKLTDNKKVTKSTGDTSGGQCSINLRYQDKRLEIVEPIPECLTEEAVGALNSRLIDSCVNVDTPTVDYRLAMIMIKKELIKCLPLSPRTSSHPPAETSSHTCT